MTTKDILLEKLAETQARLDRMREMVEGLSEPLSQLALQPSLFDGMIDFDRLSHANVVKVIQAFGGKWHKSPEDSGAVTYSLWRDDGLTIRCWAGEPPPNCRIVEEEIEIPPQPARKEKVKRLVCPQEQMP